MKHRGSSLSCVGEYAGRHPINGLQAGMGQPWVVRAQKAGQAVRANGARARVRAAKTTFAIGGIAEWRLFLTP